MIVSVDGVEIHVGPSHKIDVFEGRVVITAVAASPNCSSVFRESDGMVMLVVSDGAAYWLFAPEDTGEENLWVLSDYAVDDEDLAASNPCAPKLFTHYGAVDEDNELRGFSALPYQYYGYATEGAGRVRRMVDDVFDIALHRGTQQTRRTLEALVTDNCVLEPVERVTTTCGACNLPGRRATFQFGPLAIGRSCSKHIQAAIAAWDAYSSIRGNTVHPPVYAAAVATIQDALAANV
jgi:hypothetical protein